MIRVRFGVLVYVNFERVVTGNDFVEGHGKLLMRTFR